MTGVQFSANREGIFLFATAAVLVLGATQPPNPMGTDAPSLGVKQLGYEADQSPPSNAKVKNVWSYTFTHIICLHGMVLKYWVHLHGVVLS
jgi:hypothetical protein